MLEYIYSLFVWPFQACIEMLRFFFSEVLSGTGLSIVVSAFFMNILLMPFYSIKGGAVPNLSLRKHNRLKNINELFVLIKPHVFILFYILLFVASHVYFTSIFLRNHPSFGIIKDLTIPDGILGINLLPIIMLAAAFIAVIIIPIIKNKKVSLSSLMFMVFFLILFVVIYNASAMLCLFWTATALFLCVKNIIDSMKHPSRWYRGIILFGCLASMTVIILRHKNLGLTNTLVLITIMMMIILINIFINTMRRFFEGPIFYAAERYSLSIYRYSCVILFLLSGLVIPLLLFASSPTEFFSIGTMLAQTLCQSATLCFAVTFFYYELSPKIIRRLLMIFMPFMVVLSLLCCFVLPGDYGIITSNFLFENWKGSDRLIEFGKSILIIFVSAFVVFCLFRFKKIHWLKNGFLVIAVSFVVISGISGFSIVRQLNRVKDIEALENIKDTHVFTLSKTEENVFILFLDRATGFSMPEALKLDPKLEKSLDGFIWYSNTVSYSDCTIASYPAMLGGYEYSPMEINKRLNETLKDKVNESIKVLPKIFGDAGYNVMVTDPTYANLFHTPDPSIFDGMKNVQSRNIKGIFRARYEASQIFEDRVFYNAFNYDITMRFSLFRLLPPIARPLLYNGGKWFKNAGASNYVNLVNLFPNLLYLDDLCNVVQNGKNLNIMMNESVHREGGHNRNLELISTPIVFSEEEIKEYGSKGAVEHTYTFCAVLSVIGNWCEWLKQEGIYDNTKIIVVADHGRSFDGKFLSSDISEGRNPLLLVKDFNSRGEMLTSDAFMTNADMPAIAASSLGRVVNPFTGNELSCYAKDEEILTVNVPWRPSDNRRDGLVVDTIWELKNQNIFDSENWINLGKPE